MNDRTDRPAHAAQSRLARAAQATHLPSIPRVACGTGYPLATLEAFPDHADRLIRVATAAIPATVLRSADAVSRRWLVRAGSVHLDEIDAIARHIARPGAYFLSVNYEWGCTVAVREPAGRPELVRVLDWRTPGLGRYLVAATVASPAGDFTTLTWPGYTGILQATAPGRFAAAINQAPLPKAAGGLLPLDWATNKIALWRRPGLTPAHLLRQVFETAPDFRAALTALTETPVASPVIYALVGTTAGETAVIERGPTATTVHYGPAAAANIWRTPGWTGHPRGKANWARRDQLASLPASRLDDFAWLHPPAFNPLTRLAAIFRPAESTFIAQGFEAMQPATAILRQTQ